MKIIKKTFAPAVFKYTGKVYYQLEGATLDTPITVGQAFYKSMLILDTVVSKTLPLQERIKFVSKRYYYVEK